MVRGGWSAALIAVAILFSAPMGAALWYGLPTSRTGAGQTGESAIVLEADSSDGHESIWIRRPSAGTDSWGIRGSGRPESGEMWFNRFPGKSGHYRVALGAVLERDGDPEFRVLAGKQILAQGHYDYACGTLLCTKNKTVCPDRKSLIDLGVHYLEHDQKVAVWGRATYPCPGHGAYTRWYEIRFTPIAEVK